MTDRIDVEVLGLKQLSEKLKREIPQKARHRLMARALKRAARPMVRAARQNALSDSGSGALSASITSWTEKKSASKESGHFASVHVGPKRGNKRQIARYYQFYGKKPTPVRLKRGIFHGHFVEFGHVVRTRTGTASVPAQPFLRPAQAATDKQIIKSFGAIMAEEIEKEAAKGVPQ